MFALKVCDVQFLMNTLSVHKENVITGFEYLYDETCITDLICNNEK